MCEIINVFMCEEFIKRCEKIPFLGWSTQAPTRVNKFTTETGTLNSVVLGGVQSAGSRLSPTSRLSPASVSDFTGETNSFTEMSDFASVKKRILVI